MGTALTPPTGRPAPQRYGSVLDHLREGFQVIGFDRRYLYVNEAVCEHSGRARSELLGRTMMEAFPGIESTPMFARLSRCMESRVADAMDNEFEYPDGTTRWFELRFEPVPEGVMVLSLEISERKSLEVQLRHAQKMEALGRLAGGVAHDFNNILTVIASFGQFVLERVADDVETHADMSEVLSAAKRAELLVSQLLAFSRKQTTIPRIIDVNLLVAGIDAMLRRLLGQDVAFHTVLRPELWQARIDPGALEQVLVNLAVNARDAMPKGGKLTVGTDHATLDASDECHEGEPVVPGDYVVIACSDNGMGMDLHTRRHAFEPFFTTKGPGQGTGLGLSTCHGIVRQAGGHIWVYSEVDRGTTFKIYLPRVEGQLAPLVVDELAILRVGTEVVLVVEDDNAVRALVVRVLSGQGYQVIEAAHPADALARLEGEPGAVHLLLTDVVMPEMSGKELATRAMERCPALRVLFMSGYSSQAATRHGVLEAEDSLLQKPFSPADLLREVRNALD
jgi:PAS domain S-box-containing protein